MISQERQREYEIYSQKLEQYILDSIENQKSSCSCMKNVNEKVAWSIIQKAGLKAINFIYNEFVDNLTHTDITFEEPGGSSFRILVPKQTTAYLMGIRKISVCINLETNNNILERIKNKNFCVEVGIHDNQDNYLGWEEKNYTKKNYIKFFDSDNFDTNMKNIGAEVYDILTYQFFSKR